MPRYFYEKGNFISKLYDEFIAASIQPITMFGTPDPNAEVGFCLDVTIEVDETVTEELVSAVVNAHIPTAPPPPMTPQEKIDQIDFDGAQSTDELKAKLNELKAALLEWVV
ncbi:hypothetical protein C1X05_00165 [Laceyella sacchari]|uniref:Uncharacterized protein n=1 Tax=Laceyella tengchongensis TaxID=574699 RepID=A0AA45WQ97_9BACL|nr:hypothetical protein [Laceyella tengchongensis]AUS07426.1 hypothetical protein C1X05_00165 [Laceyella sacchari]MRG28799.1 hypothetical protein [Laceyella tengchongensis]SMP25006.1 hypothetical protein SAMN06265361_1059 [Laceyella tengchongensis]